MSAAADALSPARGAAGPAALDVGRELRQLVLDLLSRDGLPPRALELDADLDADLATLGVDSLDHIQIAARVRERYGVELTADETDPVAPFRSLRSLVTVVQRQIDGRAASG